MLRDDVQATDVSW